MLQPKSRIPEIETSIFSVMSQLAKEHGAVDMAQGFPNFQTSKELQELVTKAMKAGKNQYAPLAGIYSLRERISEKIKLLYRRKYDTETEVTVTVGATQALYAAITAFVLPGDEVIVFKPAYDSYEPAIKINGGIPVPIQMQSPHYKIDWEEVSAKITSKTKMIILNTPHNPTGRVLEKEEMEQLEKILKNTNILLLSDEVYEHLVYDGKEHMSAARFNGLAERSVICASFGKTFHNTGWKTGYCVAPKALMKAVRRVHQFQVFCVNHPMQVAYAEFLKNEKNYLELNEFYQQKRDFFLSEIKNSAFQYEPAQGTYFQLLDYSAISNKNDVDFAEELVKEHKLAAIPISPFNTASSEEKKLRFCFAKTEETLKNAAEILCSI